jgi:hypothetical protein
VSTGSMWAFTKQLSFRLVSDDLGLRSFALGDCPSGLLVRPRRIFAELAAKTRGRLHTQFVAIGRHSLSMLISMSTSRTILANWQCSCPTPFTLGAILPSLVALIASRKAPRTLIVNCRSEMTRDGVCP